jgi:hypothetical protein
MIEKLNASAFSSKLGYRSFPPNVIRGSAIVDSNKPTSGIPKELETIS